MAKPNAATDKGFGSQTDATKKSAAKSSTESKGGALGFTKKAELWNGRLAMLGFLALVLIELITNQGILEFLGIR
ncbi:chlorophyll a/b-binding protein [Baaleninema sp.]|uniref:chlorophyll a/b-binding protein n=1 Tax=Baaleninema sp. TaxID=3101197 RepID=UPI003D042514